MSLPRIGARGERSLQVSTEMIEVFAHLTGDLNPVHLDEQYAQGTSFRTRIAHGMLSASVISATIANEIPGPGSVYLGQTLRFKAPVFPGDTVTASVEVTAIRNDKPIITLATTCRNQHGIVVIEGEATVLMPT